MQKFSSDSSILNSVHSLPVTVSENEEEFDFSISNDVTGVKKQLPKISFKSFVGDLMSVFSHDFADVIFYKYLDILEIISYCRSDSNNLIDLELLANSYMIACTNIQNFEEGENYASTIAVEQTLGSNMEFIGSDMILFGSDLILLGSRFNIF